jgi:Tol biopolymer transport system component
LHETDIETGETRALTDLGRMIEVARYSPDGTTIAFLIGTDEYEEKLYRELWLMDADGSSPRRLELSIPATEEPARPRWR